MHKDAKIDLGEVQIHKKVIGDIAAEAIKEIPGVSLARFGIVGQVCDLFGFKNYPGVTVSVDKDGEVSVNIRVIIDYKMSISQTAHRIQDLINQSVEEAVDIQLREINVDIQAVERRQ